MQTYTYRSSITNWVLVFAVAFTVVGVGMIGTGIVKPSELKVQDTIPLILFALISWSATVWLGARWIWERIVVDADRILYYDLRGRLAVDTRLASIESMSISERQVFGGRYSLTVTSADGSFRIFGDISNYDRLAELIAGGREVPFTTSNPLPAIQPPPSHVPSVPVPVSGPKALLGLRPFRTIGNPLGLLIWFLAAFAIPLIVVRNLPITKENPDLVGPVFLATGFGAVILAKLVDIARFLIQRSKR